MFFFAERCENQMVSNCLILMIDALLNMCQYLQWVTNFVVFLPKKGGNKQFVWKNNVLTMIL